MPLRIDEMFGFIAEDGEGEGLAAFKTPNGWVPMVAADAARIDSLKEVAKKIAKTTGKKITLCRFSVRTELEVFER